jgi:hypothetical protein
MCSANYRAWRGESGPSRRIADSARLMESQLALNRCTPIV